MRIKIFHNVLIRIPIRGSVQAKAEESRRRAMKRLAILTIAAIASVVIFISMASTASAAIQNSQVTLGCPTELTGGEYVMGIANNGPATTTYTIVITRRDGTTQSTQSVIPAGGGDSLSFGLDQEDSTVRVTADNQTGSFDGKWNCVADPDPTTTTTQPSTTTTAPSTTTSPPTTEPEPSTTTTAPSTTTSPPTTSETSTSTSTTGTNTAKPTQKVSSGSGSGHSVGHTS